MRVCCYAEVKAYIPESSFIAIKKETFCHIAFSMSIWFHITPLSLIRKLSTKTTIYKRKGGLIF